MIKILLINSKILLTAGLSICDQLMNKFRDLKNKIKKVKFILIFNKLLTDLEVCQKL